MPRLKASHALLYQSLRCESIVGIVVELRRDQRRHHSNRRQNDHRKQSQDDPPCSLRFELGNQPHDGKHRSRNDDQNAECVHNRNENGPCILTLRHAGPMMSDCELRRDPGVACSRFVRRDAHLRRLLCECCALFGIANNTTVGSRTIKSMPTPSANG